jgi:hypothetical protein
MNLFKKQYFILLLAFISMVLLVSIWNTIDFLFLHKYVMECFSSGPISEDTNTSHTVNLPLTTTYSCQNFCGPVARCSITGQQCFADIDCPGCQPYSPPLPPNKQDKCIPGDDDAGKLTWGVTPQYSPLTSGYGTKESVVTKDLYEKPSMANFGINTWKSLYNEGKILFDKRYKPPHSLTYMPNYPERYSLTGEFVQDGPFESNSTLSTF